MSLSEITQLHLVETTDDAYALLRWLSEQSIIGIDTEGTGLSPERDHVRLVQVGSRTEGWAIPFELNSMLVHDIVNRFQGEYVTHNGPYDHAMLRKEGVILPKNKIHNTLLEAHVLSSIGSLALKPLYSTHVDDRGAYLQDDLQTLFAQTGYTWTTVPWNHPTYWMYAALDPCETLQLHDHQYPQVQRIAPDSYELELAVSWPIELMERHGALVDREFVQGYLEELQGEEKILDTQIRSTWGISPGSSAQLVDKLLSEGVSLTKLTKGGDTYSTDKYVLASLPHPLAQAVLRYREITKLTGTYLMNYLEMSQHDGRIHPSINSVGGRGKNPFEPGGSSGVRTSRMSSSDPNLQNVPKRGEKGSRIRRSFRAGEDKVWISCDADQIEMRVTADRSQDEGLMRAFHSPEDFFVTMGRDLFHDPSFAKSDPRRALLKGGMYGKVYGASPATFAASSGLVDEAGRPRVQEAMEFYRLVDERYPKLPQFFNAVMNVGRKRLREEGSAYVRSPLTGRRLQADTGRLYPLVNYLVQGMAGEILKKKILQCDAAGLGKYMILPVHDEINFEVPREEAPEVIATAREILNDDTLLSVPLTWGVSTGPNWGDAKELAA